MIDAIFASSDENTASDDSGILAPDVNKQVINDLEEENTFITILKDIAKDETKFAEAKKAIVGDLNNSDSLDKLGRTIVFKNNQKIKKINWRRSIV